MVKSISFKSFTDPNALKSIIAITRDWVMIIAVAALSIYLDNWLVYLLSVWIIGIFQFALSEAMLHEASHHNLFKNKKYNYWGELFYGLPFGITVKQFQKEHTQHHTQLGRHGDHLVQECSDLGVFKPGANMFWLWFVKPVLGIVGLYYFSIMSLKPWPEGRKVVAFWLVVISVFYVLDSLMLLVFYWVIPFIWACSSFLYWSEIEDHVNTRHGTRSNLSKVFNWLSHNNGYHYLHHKYANIPFYNLPLAYTALLAGEGDISKGFLDTYQQLKSPLPDNELAYPKPEMRSGVKS
ncbi:fatty acid desaturase family protein [Pseudoalteromonas denitrificans]|uniref:Fatty acid desaturase n=1 Tax=Pseudoalteromonas denitrificans DSM 6059 TaxID=1123010 RepID=A0A1I1TS25_9GAMM|nr:fatty acid desaturase [Pseudoalteromonas denitrificans]SFD61407.1 Fatty acid desaturase [Pseudoalteromonas denitrificans DSM 6059]